MTQLTTTARALRPTLTAFVLVAAWVSVPSVVAAQFAHQPAGVTTLDWPFAVVSAPGGLLEASDRFARRSIVAIAVPASGMFSPPNALDETRIAGGGGGARLYSHTVGGSNEVYLSLVAMINADFQGATNNSNKIFLMNTAGMNSVVLLYGPPGSELRLVWGTNTAGVTNSHIDASGILHQNVDTTPFTRGRWHSIEYYARASTSTTSRDGILRWWLDGALQGEYTNVNNGPGPFDNFVMTPTWAGSPDCGCARCYTPDLTACVPGVTPVNTRDWHWYFDHLRIVSPSGAARPDAGVRDAGTSRPDTGTPDAGSTGPEGGPLLDADSVALDSGSSVTDGGPDVGSYGGPRRDAAAVADADADTDADAGRARPLVGCGCRAAGLPPRRTSVGLCSALALLSVAAGCARNSRRRCARRAQSAPRVRAGCAG